VALAAGPKLRNALAPDLSGRPADLAKARVWALSELAGLTLRPWQEEVVRALGTERRPRIAYVQVPRKNGKTTLAAAFALSELLLLPERHVYAVSDSERNLKSVLWREVQTLCGRPGLRDRLHVYQNRLENPHNGSFLELRPGNFQASQGINPHLVLFDEVHLQRSDEVWNGMQMAGAARPDALLFGITTPGYVLAGLAHDLYTAARAADPTLWARIYEPAEPASALDDRTAWAEANPSASEPGFLESMEFDRSRLPEHEFRRFRLGAWTATREAWLPEGLWAGAARPDRGAPSAGTAVWLGFDGSWSQDSTALVGCTADRHLFVVGVWERPAHAPTDWRVPRAEVEAAVHRAFATWHVAELAADPSYWEREIEEWALAYGPQRVVAYPPTRQRMAAAVASLYGALTSGAVTHDGNPTLARHVANADAVPTAWGDVVSKEHKDSPRKIDAAIAALVAHARATVAGARPGPSVW
jgi:phage terminase large subunit-like protein